VITIIIGETIVIIIIKIPVDVVVEVVEIVAIATADMEIIRETVQAVDEDLMVTMVIAEIITRRGIIAGEIVKAGRGLM
jgi:hypothetical protein